MSDNPFSSGHDFSSLLPLFFSSRKEAAAESGPMYNFGIGDICDVPGLADVMIQAAREATDSVPSLLANLPGMQGHSELCTLLAEITEAETGWSTTGHNILLTDGGCDGIVLGAMAACGSKGAIAYNVPAFPYWCVLQGTSIRQYPIIFDDPLEYQQLFYERIIQTLDLHPDIELLLLNEPHNPTGLAVPPEQLEALGRYAASTGLTVLFDDVGRGLVNTDRSTWWGRFFSPERTIIVDSFTKRYACPGLRLGFARLSEEYMRTARGLVANCRAGVSNVSAHFGYTLASLLKELGKTYVVRDEVQRRMDVLRSVLPKECSELVRVYTPDWGIYCLITLRERWRKKNLSGRQVIQLLARQGIKMLGDHVLFPPDIDFPGRQDLMRVSIGGETHVSAGISHLRCVLQDICSSQRHPDA